MLPTSTWQQAPFKWLLTDACRVTIYSGHSWSHTVWPPQYRSMSLKVIAMLQLNNGGFSSTSAVPKKSEVVVMEEVLEGGMSVCLSSAL